MEFRILGPLEVDGDLGAIDVPGTKPRAVLAVLLLHANEPVSPERIAQALWGEDAPAGAVRTVQVHVSRLRKALGNGDVLTTTKAGYRLRVQPGELDSKRFERLVEDGRAALAGGRPDEAGAVLREALTLWRGRALADLAYEPFAQPEIARLEEQHEAAVEARIEADLAAGRHAELVGELRRMVSDHPARERLAGHLMLALYRCGRQSEALDAYREARDRSTAVGVEPGDELKALQDAILHHDASLMVEPAQELPHELEAAASRPLLGRDAELEWLRERFAETRAGVGRPAVIAGPPGMGKTQLAAALAVEVHGHGAAVLYASGCWPPASVHEVLDRARDVRRPLLIVVDDADEAGADVVAALRELSSGSTLVVAIATVAPALEALEPGALLYLKPLDSHAVGQIAALYAPDTPPDDVPAAWLLGASQGVPKQVHDVASQWARREAARTVESVAGRAAAGREQLRSMEAELAVGVAQLETVREWEQRPGDGARVVCPFKGLASFEASDAPYFFGRERLVAELVTHMVGARLLGVVGPSGSGKSSVVRAGLLPALESGVLPGSERWKQRIIRPGEHPLRKLRDAVDAFDGERFVLAVDQFEETFTACRDEREREAFIAELVRAAEGEPGGKVVIALRADFYGRCAAYPALSRLLAANHVLVGRMQREELERAIVCPARRVGLTVEDDLVEAIVDDVEDAPGALPLLSTAMLELWQHREGRRLRYAAYERTGGVRGAVARLAEDAYTTLADSHQAQARRVLLQLVALGDEGAAERRRRPLDDFDGDDIALLGTLADRRLVTISEGTAELAHEALLREWPRLRGWIDEDREGLRVERNLEDAAREWQRLKKDPGALHRGARLAEARDWSESSDHTLGDLERAFLDASLAREDRDRRTRRRVLTLVFGILAAGLIGIAIVAAIAIDQGNETERQRDLAASGGLALEAERNIEVDPELATRLALTALDTSPTAEAGVALRESTAATLHQRGVLEADSEDAWTATFSHDGRRVVTGGSDGIVRLWDPRTERRLAEWRAGHGAVLSARYGPRSDSIALGFEDGTIAVTDASLGSPRIVKSEGTGVGGLAFTADGEHIVAGLKDATVRVLPSDGRGPRRILRGHEDAIIAVDATADASRIVSAGYDGSIRLWRPQESEEAQILHRESGPVWDVAFSPDGKTVISAGDEGRIRRFDARSGRQGKPTPGGGAELFSVAFNADGTRFAAGGQDHLVRVWAVAGAPPTAVLKGQTSWITDVDFGPGREILGAGDDGTVRLWDSGRTLAWAVPEDTEGLDFSRDGKYIATGSATGVARVWDSENGGLVGSRSGPVTPVGAIFSPAGDAVLMFGMEVPDVRLWSIDADTVETLLQQPVVVARLDSSGQRLLYADEKGKLAVRDIESGDEVVLRGAPRTIYDAQFSADDDRVVISSEKGVSMIWRVDSPDRPERVLEGHRGDIQGLEYGADGRVVTAGTDRTVRVWPAREGPEVVLRGHTRDATDASFSVDGSKVVSSGMDGALRLWDSRTGVPLAVLDSSSAELYSMQISDDGKIAVLDDLQVMRVLRCEVCGPLEDVQAFARSLHPRQLTADERRRYLSAAG